MLMLNLISPVMVQRYLHYNRQPLQLQLLRSSRALVWVVIISRPVLSPGSRRQH